MPARLAICAAARGIALSADCRAPCARRAMRDARPMRRV
ncbi:hypothetical protein BURMUCF2_B0219 [Burkholderia multivorans CF2]|nr:hypothetical protein BURMUCF2_B0219 [Burkholderia multivorans CF2]